MGQFPARHPTLVPYPVTFCCGVQVTRLAGKGTAAVACGHSYTAAVLSDGSLYTWGSGLGGQLGLGPSVTRAVWPMRIFAGLEGVRCVAVISSMTDFVHTHQSWVLPCLFHPHSLFHAHIHTRRNQHCHVPVQHEHTAAGDHCIILTVIDSSARCAAAVAVNKCAALFSPRCSCLLSAACPQQGVGGVLRALPRCCDRQ